MDTVSATLGQSVTGAEIQSAPLNGRNVLDLALMAPGVIPNLAFTGIASSNGGFSVAGSRGDSITYLLDGGVNNNLLSNPIVYNPNPDTVAEFLGPDDKGRAIRIDSLKVGLKVPVMSGGTYNTSTPESPPKGRKSCRKSQHGWLRSGFDRRAYGKSRGLMWRKPLA